jgi:hypothetical protein
LQSHAAANLLEPLFDAPLEKPNHRSSFVFASRAEKMKLSAIFGPPKCDYAIFVIQREHFSSSPFSELAGVLVRFVNPPRGRSKYSSRFEA